jgi:hypothetical protein
MTQVRPITAEKRRCDSKPLSPNKHMQRAGTHKVLGRGRESLASCLAPLARVLTRWRAGADVNR